jgi:PKD repeat protein
MLFASPMFVAPALADLNADPGGPYTGIAGENVQFRGTAYSDAGRIVEYRWDFGDGSSGSRAGATINHKYGSAGTYTVSLTVFDVDGFESAPETTVATIFEATTTTAPGPSTTTTTTAASTTTTTPTSTTTTASTTTTITTPTSSSTTTPTSTTTTSPTSTTRNTSSTTTTEASDVEDVTSAEGISATLFSLVPNRVSPGGEIALTVALTAAIPGKANVQFLFDGQALGEIAVLNAADAAGEALVEAVFTRTLPAGLTSGSYRVDVVAARQPTLILATQTIEVVAELSSDPEQTDPAAPAAAAPEPTPLSMIAILAVGGTAVMAAAGLAVTARHRRRTIVRRAGK